MKSNAQYKQTEFGEIPSSWEIKKIEDVFEVSAGGDLAKLNFSKSKNSQFKYPIYSNSLNDKGLYGYSDKYQYEPECVTITARGDVGKAEYRNEPFNAIVRLLVLQPKIKVSCYFVSNFINSWLNFQHVGSAVNQLTAPMIRQREIALPPISEQQQISSILSSLDDKIELNRRMNKTLEEVCKALFKRWFVDFEFPNENGEPYKSSGGEMVESEMGMIPKGWNIGTLRDVVEFYIGGGWGNETETDVYNVPAYVIRGTDIPNVEMGNIVSLPFRYHKPSNLKTRELKKYDLIIEVSGGSKGQPVGRSTIVNNDMLQHLNGKVICASFCKLLRVNSNIYNPYLVYWQIKTLYETEDIYRYQEQSTGISNFKFEYFLDDLRILIPSNEVLKESKELFSNLHNQITWNGVENESLSKIRDSLLPRLMSGKIRVNKYEK